jgi:hypothetical protein
MPNYSFEMILAGVILLGTMTASGLKVWITRKKEQLNLNVDSPHSKIHSIYENEYHKQ